MNEIEVKIVRCKDCMFNKTGLCPMAYYYSDEHNPTPKLIYANYEDDFCSWGLKKA